MNDDDLRSRALSLAPKERRQLAEELLESLDEQVEGEAWERAWGTEVRKRIAALDAGAPTVSMEALLERLEALSDRKAG